MTLFAGMRIVVVTAGFGMYHLERDAQPEVFATVTMFAGIGVIGAACGVMADALREASVGEGVVRGNGVHRARPLARRVPTEPPKATATGRT